MISAHPAPSSRRLRGFAFDPSVSAKIDTAMMNETVFTVPWEKDLKPGPVGEYIEVIDYDPPSQCAYEPVDLNDPHLLAQDGLAPSAANPKFHQQMVYAVAMTTIKNFERALGRPAVWKPLEKRGDVLTDAQKANLKKRGRLDRKALAALHASCWVPSLRIYPHALRDANAFYSPAKRSLLFGYFPAAANADVYPHGMVYTCLSHDIVAHETTHALLDGMHPRFVEASHEDGLALHEAFADIVALFQHFTFPGVLENQIARTRGNLQTENLLGALAQEFGRATGGRGSLRDAIGGVENGVWVRQRPDPTALDNTTEPHARGAILVAAVFDAFLTMYDSRVADLKRIASGGSGILPLGDLHPDLVKRLAQEAAKTARHMLNMCIRALDYCPPVDINFGDYLRALITADIDLVPNDEHGYRTAIIDSFRARGIYPRGLRTLSEESLRWTEVDHFRAMHDPAIQRLLRKVTSFFSDFRFYGSRLDTWVAAQLVKGRLHEELEGIQFVGDFEEVTGLALDKNSALRGARMDQQRDKPSLQVHSLWPIQRARPDGTIMNQVVGSIIQTCDLKDEDGVKFKFRGGCTVVFDLDTMKLRYAIRKPINKREGTARLQRHMNFRSGLAMRQGLRDTYFGEAMKSGLAAAEPFALLHGDMH